MKNYNRNINKYLIKKGRIIHYLGEYKFSKIKGYINKGFYKYK